MFKKSFNVILILLSGIVLGTLLLSLSYMLPTNIMRKNLENSIPLFQNEGPYQHVIGSYEFSKLDNWTDCIMLGNAIYEGDEPIIEKAMKGYRLHKKNALTKDSLIEDLSNSKDPELIPQAYERYWHGYLIILKPLLLLFSYDGLRALNSIAIPLILMAIAWLLYKNNLGRYIFAYISSVILINPFVISLSLQYSTIFYLFNIAMIFILKFHKKINYIYFFLILGILTSYFDFLTYPIATLGMCAILYLLLERNNSLKENIASIIKFSLLWGIGYAGMWMGKIAIGSLLLNENLLETAFTKIQQRTSFEALGSDITALTVLKYNFDIFINRPFIFVTFLGGLYLIYKIYRKKLKITKNLLKRAVAYLTVCMMPLAWYVVLSNHSTVHYWFTFRALVVFIFGILCILTEFFNISSYERIKNEK